MFHIKSFPNIKEIVLLEGFHCETSVQKVSFIDLTGIKSRGIISE